MSVILNFRLSSIWLSPLQSTSRFAKVRPENVEGQALDSHKLSASRTGTDIQLRGPKLQAAAGTQAASLPQPSAVQHAQQPLLIVSRMTCIMNHGIRSHPNPNLVVILNRCLVIG